MSSTRVQVILDEDEREAFRREAERQGRSLSAWLREAGRERLAATAERPIETVDDLHALFTRLAEDDAAGPEPDWEVQRRVIEAALRSGDTRT